jgi:protein ImuA
MSAVMLPEAIHADLWRGNQLARARSRVVECGDADLARELPGGGWPRGALTDLLV